MEFKIIFLIIIWSILIVSCNNYFSNKEIIKENESIISNKSNFQVVITLIISYLFGVYETRDIALIIGGMLLWVLPAFLNALIEPIIIRYNDNYIEIDYLSGDRYSVKYEEIIKVCKTRRNIYISFNIKSSNNEEIPIKFSVRRNTRNGQAFIKKLKEKGINIL